MRTAIKAFLAQTRLSMISSLQYRVNYLLSIFSASVSAIVETALWRLVLKDRGHVQGYGLRELFCYLIIANVTNMVCVNWENVMSFSAEIRSGTISRHLLKPVSLFPVSTGDWLGEKIPVLLGMPPVFIALGFFMPIEFQPLLQHVFMYLALLVLAMWICAEVYFIIIASAFWVAENDGLAISFNILRWGFVGSAFPLSFYPVWLQRVLDATPLPYLVYYPTMALSGRLTPELFMLKFSMSLAMGLTLMLLRRLVWDLACRRLQTVGG